MQSSPFPALGVRHCSSLKKETVNTDALAFQIISGVASYETLSPNSQSLTMELQDMSKASTHCENCQSQQCLQSLIRTRSLRVPLRKPFPVIAIKVVHAPMVLVDTTLLAATQAFVFQPRAESASIQQQRTSKTMAIARYRDFDQRRETFDER